MKKYRGTLAILVLTSVLVLSLATVPVLRYNALRSVTELPGIFVWFNVSFRISNARDFDGANKYISYLLTLSDGLTAGRSQLLPGLIRNFEYVMDEARFSKDYKAIEPSLQRLTELDPNLYLGHMWLAKAQLESDAYKQALASAKKAIKLIPSDPRAYRIALEAAYKSGLNEDVSQLCQRYSSSFLGGTRDGKRRGPFFGTNLGQFALEYINKNGDAELAVAQSVSLGKYTNFTFSLPNPQVFESYRFHFPFQPGTQVYIDVIKINMADKMVSYNINELAAFPDGGYIFNDGSIISHSPNGMTVNLVPEVREPKIKVFDLSIKLKISKIKLAQIEGCLGNP